MKTLLLAFALAAGVSAQTVTIAYPATSEVIGGLYTMTGTATPQAGATLAATGITFKLDSVACSFCGAAFFSPAPSWFAAIFAGLGGGPLRGAHTIEVDVVDSLGGTTSTSTSFFIDNSVPSASGPTLIPGSSSIFFMEGVDGGSGGPVTPVQLAGPIHVGDLMLASIYYLRPASPNSGGIIAAID